VLTPASQNQEEKDDKVAVDASNKDQENVPVRNNS